MLAHQLRRERLHRTSSVLDLCSGSGILAVVAARSGAGSVTAVDISRRAVFTARVNAKLNGARIRAVRGDLFSAVSRQRFDVIVSNPPYLISDDAEPPRHGARRSWDAGRDGRMFLDRICDGADRHLRPGGVLLLVHSSLCSEKKTVDALAGRGFQVRVAARHRGPLGPRMHGRAPLLRGRGLLGEHEVEEVIVVRAVWPGSVEQQSAAAAAAEGGR